MTSTMYDIPEDTDVVLIIEGKRFYCNRDRLSQASNYFEAMFRVNMKEKDAELIELKGVGYEELKMLITHANYGTLPKFDSLVATHEGNFIRIRRLLEAAVMYQFDAIQDFCVSKMKTMLNISTCLKLMFLADRLGLPDLLLQAKQMCLWRFELVKEDVAFLELPCNLLVEYLSQDGLRTKDESTVFHSVVKWTNHNPEQRLPLMYEAISSVRFSDISLPEMKIIAHLPFVTNNQVVRQLVHEIWKLKFDKYIRERVMRGATSRPISPLSNISPAESVQVLDNWTPTEEDDDDVKVDCLPPISNIATEHIPETYVSEAKLLAKQLLVTRSRVLPMYPAVILRNNDFPVPHILAFNHHEKTIMMLGSLTKACEQSQVALGFTACAKGCSVYVIGGEFVLGHSNFNNSMWRYDTFTKSWHLAGRLKNPRRHHTVCVMDDDIYLIGGIGRFRVALRSVERFNTQTGNWNTAANIPNPVQCAPATVYKDKLYVLDTQVYRYDAGSDLWTLLSNVRLPHEIGLHSAMSHANGIYLVGRYKTDIILFCPEAQFEKKECVKVIGHLKTSTENACILGDTIFSFSRTDQLVVESFDICSNSSKIEYRCEDGTLSGSIYNHGCFLVPKYH